MTQTTPHAVRSETGQHSHWARHAETYCGKPATDLPTDVAAAIESGQRDVSCSRCRRHSAAVWRVLAR